MTPAISITICMTSMIIPSPTPWMASSVAFEMSSIQVMIHSGTRLHHRLHHAAQTEEWVLAGSDWKYILDLVEPSSLEAQTLSGDRQIRGRGTTYPRCRSSFVASTAMTSMDALWPSTYWLYSVVTMTVIPLWGPSGVKMDAWGTMSSLRKHLIRS